MTLPNPVAQLLSADILRESDLNNISDNIVGKILEDSDGKKGLVIFDALKKICEEVGKQLRKNIAIDEAGETIQGVKLAPMNSAGKYDYSKDSTWARMKAELTAREDMLKNQYKLKTKPENIGKDVTGIVLDGEELPVIEYVGGGMTIKLTYSKK